MDQIQTAIVTFFGRESDTLATAAHRLGADRRDLNILSFGCSIGDELATLRLYFPFARIHGCDVDDLALGVAARTTDGWAEVFRAEIDEIVRRGPYDLICAFSSLCVNPAPKGDFAKALPFERFAGVIELFADVLRPGGLMALSNTSYFCRDTPAFSRFGTLRSDRIFRNGFITLRHPDGSPALEAMNLLTAQVHRISDPTGIDDWDLVDSLFVRLGPSQTPAVERISLYDPVPDLPMEPLMAWTRSDFDTLPESERRGLIGIRRDYRSFVAENGGVWFEYDTVRTRLGGGDMLIGTVGRTPVDVATRRVAAGGSARLLGGARPAAG